MKLHAALVAFVAAREINLKLTDYDAYSMFDPSTSDYEYDNYVANFYEQVEETRGPFGAPVKHDRGSCMICNVEGESGSEAFQNCLNEAKFIHCRNDHGNEPNHERNVCMVTERRNNNRTQLNIRCQEKEACKRDQEQNASQCREYGEKDQNGIEKASTCRKCHNYAKQALRTILQGKRGSLLFNRWMK
ncbi:unnamed protein product [Oikopleura dioica]|uniref:Uncharacterized protein n=1 Tax=Oikopleura dioica TaxID=34765 RepID=E4WV74_OIKDI|nr:unnamed protein product [Oikopleura dioica]